MRSYPAHGDYQAYWQGGALFVLPSGAFNEIGASNFNKLIEEAIELHPHQSWYRLDIFQCQNTMGTPEAELELIRSFEHSKAHGCRMVLLVGANVCAKQQVINACDKAGIAMKSFVTLSEAKTFAGIPD